MILRSEAPFSMIILYLIILYFYISTVWNQIIFTLERLCQFLKKFS